MKTQRRSLVIILVLMFSSLSLGIFGFAIAGTAKTTLPDYQPIDFGPEIRDAKYEIDFNSLSELLPSTSSLPKTSSEAGDIKSWLTLDNYNGFYFFAAYELRAVGDISEIWVQVDLLYPEGDIRNDPNYQDDNGYFYYPEVTDDQVAYLLDEFENNIYPTDVATFGTPDFHDGSNSLLEEWGSVPPGYYYDEDGKNVILVSNVRDDAYYDAEYPYYIAGFYSPSFEAYDDRNIITIDSHQWYRRTGPEGFEWKEGYPVDRPYLYESTIAHEYQHLIHDDYNPDDDTWMNEACSMFAEPLCGYEIDYGSINRFLFTPDNSLTEWEDQGDLNILADYGAVFMWAMYLFDHYGGSPFFTEFVRAGIPGIDGVNAALDFLGYSEDFEDVFHDWRIANLIHSDRPGHGKYNYESLDLSEANEDIEQLTPYELGGAHIPWFYGTDMGTTVSLDGDDTGISMIGPYGSDYINMYDLQKLNFILFDGDEDAIYGWEMTDYGWYSGAFNLLDTLLVSEPIVVDDPTLYLNTYWDIEDNWDFGFVQVSTDGGETWVSLENEFTTSDHDIDAHPDIITNLPGLTGWSEAFIDITFDLSDYIGEEVLIGFRYMTDWAELYEGWYISSAAVGDVDLELSAVYPEAEFMVTIVEERTLPNGKVTYHLRDMPICECENFGISFTSASKWEDVIIIISPTMLQGFTDYKFMAKRFCPRGWKYQ